ncbi:MAG TPA: NAD(P)-binding domain-containing protein [Acidimicrobiia bacterium]|nr:NAD(P)-binding domain-containing protein [Acidimicrobiia bacterium]
MTERIFDTLVIGGGQTGLAVGHYLSKTGRTFLILDASARVGDAWRHRWDSLVLFTPAGFSGLPGMDFPADHKDQFVTKDEAADFVERYAKDMGLPVLSGVRVERLTKEDDVFVAETANETFAARNVVVAMANYQAPKIPGVATSLDPGIRQVHSHDYKSPSSLQDGPALVVGMGNSGAEIGLELARDRTTYVSGDPTAVIPFRLESWFGRKIGKHAVRFMATKVLTTSTPIGRRVRPKLLKKAAPVVRAKPRDLLAAGAERVPRVTGVRAGMPQLADGRTLDVANVVWCTGYRSGFDWIEMPIFDDEGKPRHHRGVVDEMPGLYFCGLFFQHSLWSETLTGMPRDARYVVEHLANRAVVGAPADAPAGA